MKKLQTVLVLLSMISVGTYAQGISGGAKLGLNLADQTYSGSGSYSSPGIRPDFHVGGYLTLMFTEHMGLQPEVLYSGQGAKSGSSKLKLNYITVPILFRFNVNKVLSFHAGPQFGVLASAKLKNGSNSVDYKDNYKSSDVGIAIGTTVDLPMKLNFTFRIIKGLSDINNVDNSSVKIRNFNIQLSVGYKLFGK
ncbi:MAG TPA: porin family protein [Cyclobacteriaceae bacterium]|jgi:hypothetical protein|nr:porin family protein [Cyclobacteriaceae bacterium]